MTTKMICILCPKGCGLEINENLTVTGNTCKKGEDYAREELQNPVRTLTSTVSITGANISRCPVKTKQPIPKSLLMEAMNEISAINLQAPVEEGQTVIENISSTGIPLITTRGIEAQEQQEV